MPLWLPNGAVIVEELENLAKEYEKNGGYDLVRTPHLTKGVLYEKSGHLVITKSQCIQRWMLMVQNITLSQ